MSCCPPAPELVEGEAGDSSAPTQDTQILPGESVECYMKRAENPTGLKDDLTGYVPYKIKNSAIPVGPTANISVQLELTPGDPSGTPNGTATGVSWTMTGAPAWLTLSGSTISGTSPTPETAVQVNIMVSVSGTKNAADGGGPFTDERNFNFAVIQASKDNSIQFVNPLPGGRVTSEFNPNRVHPVRGTVSPHKGVDMSTPGSATSDVVAAADGTVTFCGNQAGGAGNYVKISHFTPSGELLCTTVYMHLEKWYVAEGQKVAAGQKIGREGNTGIGTAAHLHFECRLKKNGKETWIDPLPLIRGTTLVHPATNPDNSGAGEAVAQTSDSRLTSADAEARAGGCAAFGPTYPADPAQTNDPPAGDAFEKAWFFTMKFEVGPHWSTTPQFSPGDADLDAGLKETTLQRKQVGYKNTPGYPGGETKFGIAQGPNPSIAVGTIDYANSKTTGFNNYWKKGPSDYETARPKTAIMLFDMYYLHGGGNVRGSILPAASIGGPTDTSPDDVAACNALHQAQVTFLQNIVKSNPSRQKYLNGWMSRSKALLAYVLALP